MGEDTTQTTPIDEAEYERFRQYVIDVHGQLRGNLKRELENALREYRMDKNGEDQLTRIENDVAALKAVVADAEGDGGVTGLSASDGDSTPARGSDKPAANQPRQDKIEYLIDRLTDESGVSRDSGEVPKKVLRNIITAEYNFNSNTADEYVDDMLEVLDAKQHPEYSAQFAWGERYEQAVDEFRQDTADELDRVE